MENYKRYYGVIAFVAIIAILILVSVKTNAPRITELDEMKSKISTNEGKLKKLRQELSIVQKRIQEMKKSIISSQKKVYSPVESNLGDETLFFTLYEDVIEMLHSNFVKIKSISYVYNPEGDNFVKFGKDVYFVCDVNMELVSNYTNLGKFIQALYQYPYYIKINELDIKPYAKDKKILLTNMSIRLYAHTEPEEVAESAAPSPASPALDGAATALPQ